MQSLKMYTTTQLLEFWGNWQGRDVPELYRSVLGEMRGGSVSSRTCLLTDDEVLFVDRAVAQLRLRDGLLAQVLMHYHIAKLPTRAIALRIKMSVSTTDGLIKRAETWVDAYLHSEINRAA